MIRPFSKSICAVFEERRRYLIPLFQRQYVWSQEKHWEPLWEDIRSQSELSRDRGGQDRPKHFMGAIVISEEKTWNDQVRRDQVIDGQQRLTTFQIFLAALRDVCRTVDAERAADLGKLCENTGRMPDKAREQFKIWPTASDVPHFTDVMTLGSPQAVEQRYQSPQLVGKGKRAKSADDKRPAMAKAYMYFARVLQEYVGAGPDAGERVGWIHNALRHRMELVSIELDSSEDPQVIFESLNGRNEPLLPSDLLRNFLFQRVERELSENDTRESTDRSQELYDAYWRPFDELPDDSTQPDGPRFWKVEERQGRFSRARIDLFMQHFLSMKTGDEANIGRLFLEYRDWAAPKRGGRPYVSVEAEMKELALYGEHFRGFLRPNVNTQLGLFATRLRTMDTTTVYPLLLSLLGESNLSAAERDGIVVDLESYLVRRMVCGLSTKAYNGLFLRLIQKFRELRAKTRAAFAQLLLELEGPTAKLPSDEEFRTAWVSRDLYNSLKATRVEMLLCALNRQMVSAKNGGLLPTQKLSIEHVLPQEWQEHWPLAGTFTTEEAFEDAVERRERLLHSIGNLTLVTQPLNSAVGNSSFLAKKKEYAVHAGLWLNAHFQELTEWNEDAILARAQALFQLALQTWPLPTVALTAAAKSA